MIDRLLPSTLAALYALSDAQFAALVGLANNLIAQLPKILEAGGIFLAAVYAWRLKAGQDRVSSKVDVLHEQNNGAMATFKQETRTAISEAAALHMSRVAELERQLAFERAAAATLAAATLAASTASRTPDLSDSAASPAPAPVVIVNTEAVPVSVVPPEPEPEPGPNPKA